MKRWDAIEELGPPLLLCKAPGDGSRVRYGVGSIY